MTPKRLFVFVDEDENVLYQVSGYSYYQVLSIAKSRCAEVNDNTAWYSVDAA